MSTALPLPPNATLVKLCQGCHHTEEEHLLSPPGYNSSDGLPTFEGCAGGGYLVDLDRDPEGDFPIFVCQCWEFEDPDAVEPEDAPAPYDIGLVNAEEDHYTKFLNRYRDR